MGSIAMALLGTALRAVGKNPEGPRQAAALNTFGSITGAMAGGRVPMPQAPAPSASAFGLSEQLQAEALRDLQKRLKGLLSRRSVDPGFTPQPDELYPGAEGFYTR